MWKLLAAWIHDNHVDTIHFKNLHKHGKQYSKDWVLLVIVLCNKLDWMYKASCFCLRESNTETIKQHKQEASRIWQHTLIYEQFYTPDKY